MKSKKHSSRWVVRWSFVRKRSRDFERRFESANAMAVDTRKTSEQTEKVLRKEKKGRVSCNERMFEKGLWLGSRKICSGVQIVRMESAPEVASGAITRIQTNASETAHPVQPDRCRFFACLSLSICVESSTHDSRSLVRAFVSRIYHVGQRHPESGSFEGEYVTNDKVLYMFGQESRSGRKSRMSQPEKTTEEGYCCLLFEHFFVFFLFTVWAKANNEKVNCISFHSYNTRCVDSSAISIVIATWAEMHRRSERFTWTRSKKKVK